MYERAVRKQAARQEELAASGKSEKLRLYGELLSANLYMAQKGMKSITVPNWYDEGKEVTIPLDLRFSPSQNAQNFFKNYKKKQTAARMLVDLLAEGEKEIAYLETVLYEVETAAGEAALNEIRAELKSQGYLKYYKQRDKRQKPADFLRFTSSDGFEILVGRNNAQNDKLTLHTARGKDLWFHVQKAPGSHVVVMSRGEDIPDTTRQEAAELAVIYSSAYKAGTGAKVAVDTTEVKNIWKASGASFLFWMVDMAPGFEFGGITGDCNLATNVLQPGANAGMALVVECLFTFFFVLVVLGATDSKKGFGNFAGVAIGLALGLVNIVGIPVDNCSVNPARSFGPALWCPEAWPDFWIMVVGPLVGALIAALCWKAVSGYLNNNAIEG